MRGAGAGGRRLIVHADDLGVSSAINAASVDALERGLATAASVIVPGPCFAEAADYTASHPLADIGIHLTITCEVLSHRWGPVAPAGRVPSLLGPDGSFWGNTDDVARHARPDEVAIELGAQISAARRAGVKPTHLDTHMLALFRTPALLAVLRDVARAEGIPCADPFARRPSLVHMVNFTLADCPAVDLPGRCDELLSALRPGTTQLNVHCGYDTPELRAIVGADRSYGAAWRQRDWEILGGQLWQSAVRQHDVQLCGWRE